MKKNTFIDLFSGSGGLSLGFSNNGFELLLANDIDNQALNTIRYNLKITHPNTNENHIIHGDITEIYKNLNVAMVKQKILSHKIVVTNKSIQIKKRAPSTYTNEVKEYLNSLTQCDVIIGGPPCQGFSMIGRAKRGNLIDRTKGFIDDPRNSLFSYYLKFVEKLNPKLVLIENVKGLKSASEYESLIKNSLKNIGKKYDVESILLNTKDFGIPQNRERIFFIGIRKELKIKDEIGSVSHCSDGFFLKERPLFTADPLLHAGFYYVQEANSMWIGEVARWILRASSENASPEKRKIILDVRWMMKEIMKRDLNGNG